MSNHFWLLVMEALLALGLVILSLVLSTRLGAIIIEGDRFALMVSLIIGACLAYVIAGPELWLKAQRPVAARLRHLRPRTATETGLPEDVEPLVT